MERLITTCSIVITIVSAIVVLLSVVSFLIYMVVFKKRIEANGRTFNKYLSICHIFLPKVVAILIIVVIIHTGIVKHFVVLGVYFMPAAPFLILFYILGISVMHAFRKPNLKNDIIGVVVSFFWMWGATGFLTIISWP